MRTFMAVLIGIVLLPAVISNPERSRLPTVSADTVMLREVRHGSQMEGIVGLGGTGDFLVVERPAGASEGATLGVFVLDEDGVLVRVAVEFGRASPSLIQIVRGVQGERGVSAGDRIVVSDMGAWAAFDRLRLR